MNIAFFTDTYLPDKNGVATSVSQLKSELEAMGHNIYIYTVKHADQKENEFRIMRWPSVTVMRNVPESRIAFTNPATIAAYLIRDQVDIVHTHSEFSLGLTGRFVSKMLNIPHVHTVHTMWADYRHYILNGRMLSNRQIGSLFRAFVRPCTAIVAPSNKAFFYLKSIGIHPYHVNNGLSIEEFINRCSSEKQQAIKEKLGLTSEDFTILFVGRISDEKRVLELYDVISAAMKQQNNIKAIFIGRGDKAGVIEEKIKKNNQEGRFILTGTMPYEEIANYYAVCQAYCTVSTSEVQPMTVIEAMTMALPIVVHRDHAFDNLIEHGKNGYIGENDDEVRDYLIQLAANPEQAHTMGHQSQILSEHFTSEIQAKNMLKLYNKVVAMGRPHFGFHPVLEKQDP